MSLCEAFVNVGDTPSKPSRVVTSTRRIVLQGYQYAHNPSIVPFKDGYLMTFRYIPDYCRNWVSVIGIVMLDKEFNVVSTPQVLDTRFADKRTPSQSEDARIFACNGKLYVIYNDNMEITCPNNWQRRDMYIAEVLYDNNHFHLASPLKLIHTRKYQGQLWQKNWNPFEWQKGILLSYTLNPHEVVVPDLTTGACDVCYETGKSLNWNLGPLRGSTPALLVDGEYLAFFHSGVRTTSPASPEMTRWHYFMGAYTFSANPPFDLLSYTPQPIDAPGFYTYSGMEKRVIYPGGFVVVGSKAYVAYGKDDAEVWIATIDLQELKKTMVKAQ